MSAPSSRSEIARRTFRRLVVAQALANGPPSIVVAAFLIAVLGTDGVDVDYVIRNTTTLFVYGNAVFAATVVAGRRRFRTAMRWYGAQEPPSDAERDGLLRLPLAAAAASGAGWGVGGFVFVAVNLHDSLGVALVTGATILLGGASTSALSYLAVERILRPVVAAALAEAPPPRPVGPSVGARISVVWLLTSGLPSLTILGVAAATLLGAGLAQEQMALAAAFFAGGVLVVGLVALRAAARSVARPIAAMRDALARVEAGDFEGRIAIEDASEVGLLQAGFNRMAEGLGERERLRETFGIYLDPDVAEHVLREGPATGGEEVEVTVMFLDVRDFTGFAERATATEVVAALNGLFERVVPIVHAHGGHVDKFVGDGLLAVFGAPRRAPDHARRAVAAALDIAREAGALPLAIGIGLNSGRVVAGNVGGGGRLEFSVIGDAVNLAARVEAATRETGDAVLVAERTRELAGGDGWVARPGLTLKGRREPVCLFAPAGREAPEGG